MPPKKKGGKNSKPEWMSPELYDLSLNLPKLQEFWSGELKESKGKDKDKPQITISRTQAGLFILQLLYPNNKQGKAKRQESVKLGVVEVIADPKQPAIVPAVLSSLQNHESAPLKAALCSFMRVLTKYEETSLRLWRYLKDWDWAPLIQCLCLQDVSQLGGRNAAYDTMAILDSFCSHPKGDIGNSACTAVVKADGIRAIVDVLYNKVSHPLARAAGLSVLNQIMRRSPAATCEEVMMSAGGLMPCVSLLDHPVVPLINKAHAAGTYKDGKGFPLDHIVMNFVLWPVVSVLDHPVVPLIRKAYAAG
ncbi:hypothetical protein DUNSADRAFT_17309 [Dunaliella salina]|uniref:Uncharacterized protein n=1 Tax=Dunaliella salina TaxID=3046 RepID=A0ABQ7G209_DUNSA|nr:hypothetical protein DUNSADRAFT_17309 [Dunaliella salina]|eukprot:KAF5828620.1 hypothetical protein DUNSADRAFT_17309 [Dunaliella salina]